jgi:uncharacterized membrane protein YgaE (UPF0421/DUF939 family)
MAWGASRMEANKKGPGQFSGLAAVQRINLSWSLSALISFFTLPFFSQFFILYTGIAIIYAPVLSRLFCSYSLVPPLKK